MRLTLEQINRILTSETANQVDKTLSERPLKVEELVAKLNQPEDALSEINRAYLLRLAWESIQRFTTQYAQSMPPMGVLYQLVQLAEIRNPFIYRAVISAIVETIKDHNLVRNAAAFTMLSQVLSQVHEDQAEYDLTNAELVSLLGLLEQMLKQGDDEVTLKSVNQILDSLIVTDGQLADAAKEELKKVLKQIRDNDKKTSEVRYLAKRAGQALLHADLSDPKARLKRRALAGLSAGLNFAVAGASAAIVAASFGATSPFAIPGMITSTIGGLKELKKAVWIERREAWYDHLLDLKGALIWTALKEPEKLPKILEQLRQAGLPTMAKQEIAETLFSLLYSPSIAIEQRTLCLESLLDFYRSSNYKKEFSLRVTVMVGLSWQSH